MDELVLKPMIQYGFLGFSGILLGVVIWLIRRLLVVLDANNTVISANTDAIRDLTGMTADLMKLTRSMHDKLISRPCMARGERT